ncbi:unnamed protein product [Boreogadus saida]
MRRAEIAENGLDVLSASALQREQKCSPAPAAGGADDNLIEGGEMKFVCKPGARNITVIFQPLLSFIQEIEMNMGPSQAKQCQLRTFLTYYINDLFLNQVRTEINKEIESVSQTADPLKTLANADTMKLLGVQRPLLQVGHRARVLQGVQRPLLQVGHRARVLQGVQRPLLQVGHRARVLQGVQRPLLQVGHRARVLQGVQRPLLQVGHRARVLQGVQRPLLQVGHRARVLQGVQRPLLQFDTSGEGYVCGDMSRSSFVVGLNKTKTRNSLALDGTLSSIMTIKMADLEPCFKWEPPSDVLKASKKATGQYNRAHRS